MTQAVVKISRNTSSVGRDTWSQTLFPITLYIRTDFTKSGVAEADLNLAWTPVLANHYTEKGKRKLP